MSWDAATPDGTGPDSLSGATWRTPDASAYGPATPPPPPGVTPELSTAPLHWLGCGIGAALVGLLIPILSPSAKLAVIGWILGGTISIIFLGVFVQKDVARRAAGWARTDNSSASLRVLLLGLAASAVILNAWQIADAVARREW